ncbi:MAG TPA: hypothetical protein VGO86_18120 [Candidatus Dormibacteraeota bacterium]
MMKLIAGVLGIALLAACGSGRTQADQDKDGRTLAGALRAVDVGGASFKLDNRLQLTGGDIPRGQALQLHATADSGVIKDGAAHFGYRVQQAQQATSYDMLVSGGRLYVKHQGSSTWKTAPDAAATTLFAALRLELVRETALLAASVSSGAVTRIDTGFARKYVVRPAPDQLEQLQSIPVQGAAEDRFLKTATGELDLYLMVPGGNLGRIEVHLSGIDPSNGEKQEILSTLDLRSARVGALQPPADAQQVAPAELLT